jgi:hypothetical protein
MDSWKLIDARSGVGYLESIGHGAADCTGVTRRRRPLTSGGRHMLIAPIAATDRTTDARLAAKHADAALRRMTVVSAAGDRPAARDGRRFEFALVRRIASAQ